MKKYIVPQNYKKYSWEDQAVWRFITKGIFKNLSLHGHSETLKSLIEKGINTEKIPKITNIDKNLKPFGWRAVCISGFIPPRAFMEFQKHKIIPIASELRAIQHIFYTPAPDIVHEAVGHLPFLDHPVFSEFLSAYADAVLNAVSSQEDMERYKAIRLLSDLKESSKPLPSQIRRQEKKLQKISKNMSHVSEASYLSRFIWWTSEYGLRGDLKNPKVYGAGLISSIGEFLQINTVKKLRLSSKCLEYPFDITDFQPQLFVAKDFEHLLELLEAISKKLAFHRGGSYGVKQALLSKTVNTVVLDSGLQISGVLEKSLFNDKDIHFLKFKGAVQLCYGNKQIKGHGKDYHREGYSTPLNAFAQNQKKLFLWNQKDMARAGLKKGRILNMTFKGGIRLKGELLSELRKDGRLMLLQFKNCLITDQKNHLLYHPSWGFFDLAVGCKVLSVFSGPADPKAYQLKDDFKPSEVSVKKITKKDKDRFALYKKINQLKKLNQQQSLKKANQLTGLLREAKKQDNNWLLFLELLSAVKEDYVLKKKVLFELDSVKRVRLQGKPVFKIGKRFYEI